MMISCLCVLLVVAQFVSVSTPVFFTELLVTHCKKPKCIVLCRIGGKSSLVTSRALFLQSTSRKQTPHLSIDGNHLP